MKYQPWLFPILACGYFVIRAMIPPAGLSAQETVMDEIFLPPDKSSAGVDFLNQEIAPNQENLDTSIPGTYAPVMSTSALIVDIATAHGLDPALIRAMIAVESGGNERAWSPAWAMGLMQITPATAAQYGFEPSRLFDGRYNLTAGCHILRSLLERHGTLDAALMAFNTGSPLTTEAGKRYLKKIKEEL